MARKEEALTPQQRWDMLMDWFVDNWSVLTKEPERDIENAEPSSNIKPEKNAKSVSQKPRSSKRTKKKSATSSRKKKGAEN
jgi:hypothetical protein